MTLHGFLVVLSLIILVFSSNTSYREAPFLKRHNKIYQLNEYYSTWSDPNQLSDIKHTNNETLLEVR